MYLNNSVFFVSVVPIASITGYAASQILANVYSIFYFPDYHTTEH